MPALKSQQGIGIILGFIGGLVISFDVPVIRMAQSDPWLMMFARGVVCFPIYLFILFGLRGIHDTPRNPFASIT